MRDIRSICLFFVRAARSVFEHKSTHQVQRLPALAQAQVVRHFVVFALDIVLAVVLVAVLVFCSCLCSCRCPCLCPCPCPCLQRGVEVWTAPADLKSGASCCSEACCQLSVVLTVIVTTTTASAIKIRCTATHTTTIATTTTTRHGALDAT